MHNGVIAIRPDYIAPGVPHQPRNLDPERWARAVVARNTPHEQESLVPYAPS